MSAEKVLTLLHFNDVYNIEAGPQEPVGGAARFATKVKSFVNERPLILFSGDCFNPSIMSVSTMGRQMVPVLNAIGVHCAVVGNHDLDYGIDNFVDLSRQCNFPWLMANVRCRDTGVGLGGVGASKVIEWQGVRVGIMGLVEEEWLETLACVDEDEVAYVDYVEAGTRLAQELRAEGADVIIALTHMRLPNDLRLAAQVAGIDLVLGGHDHDYCVMRAEPTGTAVVKSGTDFRTLTRITIRLIPGEARALKVGEISTERHDIRGDLEEDPEVAQVVEDFVQLASSSLEEEAVSSAVELDGRFATVRSEESNLGNFVCDALRQFTHSEVAFLNAGTLRSDVVHPAGPLTFKDWYTILPMMDETVVVACEGQVLLQVLENSVSQYPKLEGRFLQVSGVRFAFDPRLPPHQRIIHGSVTVGSEPLDSGRTYKVATKQYLVEGKDGYDCLVGHHRVLVEGERCPHLQTCVRNIFRLLLVMNLMDPKVRVQGWATRWMHQALGRGSQQAMSGASTMCQRDVATGQYVIAPRLEGRIINVVQDE